MKIGDLVKISDESRSPTDVRRIGTVMSFKHDPITNDRKVRVLWQLGRVLPIPSHRLTNLSAISRREESQR